MRMAERTVNIKSVSPFCAFLRAGVCASFSFFMLFSALCNPVPAFALDERYTDISAWSQCEAAEAIISNEGDYQGVTEYFFDGSVFYAHISYIEANMLKAGNVTALNVDINYGDGTKKHFSVADDSCTADSKEFTVCSKFYTESSMGQDICLIIEPKTKALCTYASIDLSITINNVTYEIFTGLKSPDSASEEDSTEAETEKKTTQAQSTTKQSAEKTASKEQTTKFKYNASSVSGANSEKYTPESGDFDYSDSEQEYAEEGEIISVEETERKVSFSPTAKALLTAAAAFGAVGVFLFLKAAISSVTDKKNAKLAEKTNTAEENADNGKEVAEGSDEADKK